MELLIATLCDSASDYQGKLSLLGAFDTICAARMPVVHPQCSLALRLCFRPEDEGKHSFRFHFIDDDGRPVMEDFSARPITMNVRLPDDNYFLTRNLIINFQRLRFEHPGHYSIDVHAGDEILSRIPLRVLQLSAAPQPSSPD
ncbi:MAG TPA: hypothetical protein VMN36_09595 [Verrucomicrobiales bacterium]|nr:hypothetical protein [Verrucomicrobiales bacterium]